MSNIHILMFQRCCIGSEKKNLLADLSITADGQMLPLIIIFKGKTEQTIRDLNINPGFIVKIQESLNI